MKTFLKWLAVLLFLPLAGIVRAETAVPDEIPAGMSRIIFESAPLNANTLGAHLLLDSTARSANLYKYSLPYTMTSPGGWRNRAQFYDTNFVFRVPADASVADSLPVGMLNGAADTVDIPAGVYDYLIAYYSTTGYMYASGGDWGKRDDMNFEAGYTYRILFNTNTMAVLYPPYELVLGDVSMPAWGHRLGTEDAVSIAVCNMGTETVRRFEACYSVNSADTVSELVDCSLEPGDTLVYTFTRNPDFTPYGELSVLFFIEMENDFNRTNNSRKTTLYHPAVRAIPFHEDFEHADSLKHWQKTDLSVGTSYSRWDFTSRADLGALGTSGFVTGNSYSTPSQFYLVSDPFAIDSGIQHVSFYYTGGNMTNPEKITLLYGFCPDVTKMEPVGNVFSSNTPVTSGPPQLHKYGWLQAVFNIDFHKDSVYYFAFGICTETSGTHMVYLDEIEIGKGKYDIIPDLDIYSLLLPPSSCTLGEERIGVVLRNTGKKPMYGYTLSYRINGDEWVTESFGDTLAAASFKYVYMGRKFDFSASRTYTIDFAGACDEQDNYENDTLRAVLHHYTPVSDYPYTTDFSLPTGLQETEWYADTASKWNIGEVGIKPSRAAGLLHSRCMDMEKGVYRVMIRYKAGYKPSYLPSYDEFAVGFSLLGSADRTTIFHLDQQYTDEKVVAFDTVFEIMEEGTYTFYIDPMTASYLQIAEFVMERAFYNDIRLESFASSTLAASIPASQTGGMHVFSAVLKNRGLNEVANAKIRLFSMDADSIVSEISDSISYFLPASKPSEVLTVTGQVFSDSTDQYPEDNIRSVSVMVSDSVMASDFATLGRKISGYFSSAPVGNIYTLIHADTLTSFTTSLTVPNNPDSLDFLVYRIEKQDGIFSIVEPICEKRFLRRSLTGLQTYALPSVPMEAGTYFVALKSPLNEPGYKADSSIDGKFYVLSANASSLSVHYGFGNMILRANFGPEKSPYAVADIAVYALDGPADSTRMTSAEKITAKLVNYDETDAESVPVEWEVDGRLYYDTVDIPASTAIDIDRIADFSEEGSHSVCIRVNWYNDPDSLNNVLCKTFVCRKDAANSQPDRIALSISPNPASSEVLVYASDSPIRRIMLLDMQGTRLYGKAIGGNRASLNVGNLPDGVYVLHIETGQGTAVRKLIVKH